MSHHYKSTLDPLVESDRESFMSDRTFAMPAYNASNLDPLNESDNESITSDRDLSELSDLARVVMAASYSPLRDTSRSDVSQPPPMRSVSPMMRDTSYLNRDTSYLSPSHPRPMSITGTHFDNACPSTNSSEVFNIDTEYRGRTLPYTNLATNYYSRVPSGSTDGRRSTSLLLEDRQPLTENDKDPYLVEWDGEYDRDCPLNWDKRRKWTVTIIVSCFTFLSPFASTMVTPALDIIGDEYDIDGGFNRALVMSIFLLGYAQGPFVLSSLSEIFGRVSVLQITNLVFLAFNTAAPFARNSTELYLFRFLSGIGGSAPQVLCNGVLADTWRKEERGKGQAIYGILTFIAPAVAPIVGAYTVRYLSWRWIFWVTSIMCTIVQLLALLCLSETYSPVLLARKAAKLRKSTGDEKYRAKSEEKTFWTVFRRAMVRPFYMLLFHPAVQAPSLYRAFLYGVMYLVLSTFSPLLLDAYDMSRETASLHYLSLGIGFIIGLQISHPVMDGLYAYLKRRHGVSEGIPEWRVPPMLIGGLIVPAGLVVYGWAGQNEKHWAIVDAGCVLFAIGLIIAFQCTQAYITDTYGQFSASASAAGAFLRTMAGFSFPLFAPKMYDALGLLKGNILLASLTLVLVVLSPIGLWFFGKKLRKMSEHIPQ